jgi:hypothetical protein
VPLTADPPDGGGWPLIPRELLPAPVPAVRERHRRHEFPADVDPGRQLSFFDAETVEPSPADLAGLLAGPGVLGRMGGTARVTVPVDAAWRVHVLIAELTARGLEASWQPLHQARSDPAPAAAPGELQSVADPAYDDLPALDPADDDRREEAVAAEPGEAEGGEPENDDVREKSGDGEDAADEEQPRPRFEVRTAYSRRLIALARAWPDTAAHLFLSGPRLRLWVAAAGEPARAGYALGLDPAKDLAAIDAALLRAGLAGRVSEDRRHYRIMGKRRVRRLAELVGERPEAAPEDMWPGGAGA